MAEEKSDIGYQVQQALDFAERYVSKLPKEEQDRFYHAGIAGYFAFMKDILPEGRYASAKVIIDAMINYHSQKAGLEARVVKYDAVTGKKPAEKDGKRAEQRKMPYDKQNQAGYDNPATIVPLPTPPPTAQMQKDDIPF